MAKHVSETPATKWLKHKKVVYSEHPYDYVDHGGTAESSKQLGVPEHEVVKTLVMQDENGKGLVVLMHGDCKTSTKNSDKPELISPEGLRDQPITFQPAFSARSAAARPIPLECPTIKSVFVMED